MLAIAPLVEHRELAPLICTWFRDEWPEWYGPDGPGDADADVSAFARSANALPVGLVAFAGDEPVGIAALKPESLPTHKHLTPWAAAGLVLPSHRGKGIGHHLLNAVVKHAGTLGFDRVYCGTATAVTLLRRSGWSELEVVEHDGCSVALFETRTAA